jgi:chemotaxis protein MotB
MRTRARYRRRSDHEPGIDDWLMTYADMITLLLCFFAVFLSISQPKNDKIEQAKKEVEKVFANPEDIYERTRPTPRADNLPSGEGLLPDNPFGLISTNRNVKIQPGDRVTTIEMNSSAFFGSGAAGLNPEGRKILANIVDIVRDPQFADYKVVIEGHTDDAPIATAQFPSNWELSTARAASVVRMFIENGFPANRLQASGYADTFPKLPNRDASGKAIPDNQAQNRRVLIRLEKIEKAAK